MSKKKIAIIGATGYTGSGLCRILVNHPKVEISYITSESQSGKTFSEVHPFFKGIVDIPLIPVSELDTSQIDLAFLALPHGVSMDFVRRFHNDSFPLIDLSGDFRLNDVSTYEQWYKKDHSFPQGIEEAVYGLPEIYGKQIKKARLIANPGCYPTSVLLAIYPLLKEGIIDPNTIIADSKSGVTGAGVKAKPVNHFSSVNENFKPYGLKTHRHSIEIEEKSTEIAGKKVHVQFTPHLLPIDRGILSTVYVKPSIQNMSEERLKNIYKDYYSEEPFIRLKEVPPEIKQVRGTNYCDIFSTFDSRTGNIIVISVIDNLVKGAAGQAVQNMNILFDWDVKLGLNQVPVSP